MYVFAKVVYPIRIGIVLSDRQRPTHLTPPTPLIFRSHQRCLVAPWVKMALDASAVGRRYWRPVPSLSHRQYFSASTQLTETTGWSGWLKSGWVQLGGAGWPVARRKGAKSRLRT